jgi:glutamate synthase (NADPH/NADH) large chain
MRNTGLPRAHGLYDPKQEKDSCGIALVAHVKGERSHTIVSDGLTALMRMSHRSASGVEENTGDGSGILLALPDEFFRAVGKKSLGFELPEPGKYGVGMWFLPRDRSERARCKAVVERFIAQQGQRFLGWRRVPTDNSTLGNGAKQGEPMVEQVFVRAARGLSQDAFERQLYLIRKQSYHEVRRLGLEQIDLYNACSFSTKVIVYKGQLTPEQLHAYYPDLSDETMVSHLAIVHARFSTNTFPNWSRAQPMRLLCHNGEINTLQGNVNWMRARQALLRSDLFGPDFDRLFPVVNPETSDSGILDNVLELLVEAGRSVPEAIMMLIPEAWENHESMSPLRRAFYQYNAGLMEPWDGPAGVLFGDGRYAGGVLDRNGLRPCRYWITKDDRVVLSSEVGVLDVPPEGIKAKGRLQPGRMFLVDFKEGRIIEDEEIKEEAARARPYGEWLARRKLDLRDLPSGEAPAPIAPEARLQALRMFGYTSEHLSFLLRPMVDDAKDPLGSMGNDEALAVLSDRPRLLYDYFKQLFAQVTNPPIDSTRESAVMSLLLPIGPEGNLLETTEAQAERLWLPHPILTNEEMVSLSQLDQGSWQAATIDITYPRSHGAKGLERALDRICQEATRWIQEGVKLLVLSDRKADSKRVPLPALLAVGGVHHHLVRTSERTMVGLLLESGEPRSVHHFCTLLGYGADGINPYIAYEALAEMADRGMLGGDWSAEERIQRYRDALGSGILKVMAKMGISALTSYRGAQIFEAVGLAPQVMDRCFAGSASRLKGAGFDYLAKESLRRHDLAFARQPDVRFPALPNPGEFHWRAEGERRMWNPATVAAARHAAVSGEADSYKEFSRLADEESINRCTIRSLLDFKKAKAIPVEEVEPASEIVKSFTSGAMSFGALSKEAHETLAVAMNRIGAKSNSGEGGEDAERFEPLANGDSRRSAIKQVASGRFGVTMEYLIHANQLQIKMAQGAKPGEGGELPGRKVSEAIARVRHTTPGVMLISPPPHHDIYSIEDLAQLIFDLKNANPYADVSVKLVSAVGVGTVAAGVAKARSDHILISGHDGGTGASPLTSIKHAGLPWELGISDVHQTLVMNGLRDRVRVEVDGQLKTGRDVVIGALLGAEEFGFSTAPLIAMGCIMMRKCHLNTCPVGITSHDPVLRARFSGTPEHVINYLFLVAEEVREILASLGFRRLHDAVGRCDLLVSKASSGPGAADKLDLTPILTPAVPPVAGAAVIKSRNQRHKLEEILDQELLRQARAALEDEEPVTIEMPIRNVNRTTGTLLSHYLVKTHGPKGLPDDTIRLKFKGSAGQSMGAWLASGITLELEGDANDYVGKGLSGGRLIVRPPEEATFEPEENVIIGNVALYGATSGEAFFRGLAGERFCVRNSGASAVVEGCGEHGCEYMTGGRAVILGPTGRNFAAGMSGGIAYVWDPTGEFAARCNRDLVDLESFGGFGGSEAWQETELRRLVAAHVEHTGSSRGRMILQEWDRRLREFVRVIPSEYRKVMEQEAGVEVERSVRAARAASRRKPAGVPQVGVTQ